MPSSSIVVDASAVVRLFLGGSDEIRAIWRGYAQRGDHLIAPTLLHYEVTNALHRAALGGLISRPLAQRALLAALELPITLVGDPDLHRDAWRLTEALGLKATYDMHYLALAVRERAALCTADLALARHAEARGVPTTVLRD